MLSRSPASEVLARGRSRVYCIRRRILQDIPTVVWAIGGEARECGGY